MHVCNSNLTKLMTTACSSSAKKSSADSTTLTKVKKESKSFNTRKPWKQLQNSECSIRTNPNSLLHQRMRFVTLMWKRTWRSILPLKKVLPASKASLLTTKSSISLPTKERASLVIISSPSTSRILRVEAAQTLQLLDTQTSISSTGTTSWTSQTAQCISCMITPIQRMESSKERISVQPKQIHVSLSAINVSESTLSTCSSLILTPSLSSTGTRAINFGSQLWKVSFCARMISWSFKRRESIYSLLVRDLLVWLLMPRELRGESIHWANAIIWRLSHLTICSLPASTTTTDK